MCTASPYAMSGAPASKPGIWGEEQQLFMSCSRTIQKPQTSCRLLASSADQFALTEWRRRVQMFMGRCCFGANCAWRFCSISSFPIRVPYRGITGRLVSLGYKARRRGCLSSAAPGFGLSDEDISHALLPGNFRSPNEGFTVWR